MFLVALEITDILNDILPIPKTKQKINKTKNIDILNVKKHMKKCTVRILMKIVYLIYTTVFIGPKRIKELVVLVLFVFIV